MARNTQNKFLNELKTVIENGYTLNSEAYLGTNLDVEDYKGDPKSVFVKVGFPSKDDLGTAAVVFIHSLKPASKNLFIGNEKRSYTVIVEGYIGDSVEKTVDGDVLAEDALAQYLLEQISLGIDRSASQFSAVDVYNLDFEPSGSKTGKAGDSNLYGFIAHFSLTLS